MVAGAKTKVAAVTNLIICKYICHDHDHQVEPLAYMYIFTSTAHMQYHVTI